MQHPYFFIHNYALYLLGIKTENLLPIPNLLLMLILPLCLSITILHIESPIPKPPRLRPSIVCENVLNSLGNSYLGMPSPWSFTLKKTLFFNGLPTNSITLFSLENLIALSIK